MRPNLYSLLLVLFLVTKSVFVAHAFDGIPGSLGPIDEKLKKRVEFWVRMYTEVSTHEGLVHDAKYPEVVYEKLDFNDIYDDFSIPQKLKSRRIQRKIDEVKHFYKRLLLSLHQKEKNGKAPAELNDAEKRVYELYKDVKEPSRFLRASHPKRLRWQLGQKDRFMQGLFYSGSYLPLMEKIFKDKGVPPEITRLPFVESSFNLKARSKVGASGIWQFMRSTGKFYLKINETVDERNDPLKATEAAAELLKLNYESLKNWSLAITAYNHGRKGMMRAVRKVGSEELQSIIENYRSRNFGFASSNFFCEFLAAVEVEKNAEKYFGPVERDKFLEFVEFALNDYVEAADLSTYTRIPMDSLMELNPGLTDLVFKGKKRIPAGFTLRVPTKMKDTFLARYSQIPASRRYASQKGVTGRLATIRGIK